MSNKFKAAVSKFRSFPAAIRWSTYTLSAYFFYAAVLGLLVPYIAKQQIPEQVSVLIERPVELGDITINPFTLQLDVAKFVVFEKVEVTNRDDANQNEANDHNGTPFIKFDHASVQLNFWQSIFNGAISVEYITLDTPYINLERLDNQDELLFNFSDILVALARNSAQSLSSEAEAEAEAEAVVDRHAALFPILIKRTALNEGDIRLLDGVTGTQLHYPSINISLGEFATQSLFSDAEKKNQYRLHITDADSATIELTGQVQLKPLEVVGQLDVQHIQLPRLWGFIAQEISAKLTSGDVNLSSNYHLAQTIGQTPAEDTLSISTSRGMFSVNQLDFTANGQSIVTLPNLSVNDIATNVENQTLNIASITSQGLNVVAKVGEQGVDLVSLFTPKSSVTAKSPAPAATQTKPELSNRSQPMDTQSNGESSESAAQAAPSWLVTLNGIEIKDYQLNVEEKLVTAKANRWVIAPINLTTGQIVSDLSQPIEFDFSTAINGKGQISVKGQADAKQQALLADIDVKSLKLAQFQPYLATAVNATLTKGEVSTQAKLNANAQGQVTLSGGVQVNHLSIRDNKLKKPFVKWRSLAVNSFNFDLQKSALAIDTLSLSQPYARVVINKDRSTNLGDLMVSQASSQPKGKASHKQNPQQNSAQASDNKVQQPFALSVRKITFNDGSAFFADNSLTPNFSSGIEQLKGTIGDVSSVPGTKATVDISGNIDRYAPVKVKGEINPLLAQPYLDLDVIFKSVELTTVNPYSGTYAGHYIDKGQLTLALNYQLENNQLKGENHVVINQLQLGQASDSDLATSLPIKLAIALLQDNDGVIDLGVEVSGDVDDPEFNLGAIIWNTISNIITKAVTAPFSFISDLAGSDDELNIIAFEFGANTLTLAEQEKLQTLGKALETRPKLTLTVDGAIDAVPDSQALALQQFKQKLATTAKITVAELPSDLSASTMPVSGVLSQALQRLYTNELGEATMDVRDKIEDEQEEKGADLSKDALNQRWHIALYNMVLNHQQVAEGQLGQLAQQRAQAVKAYLVDAVKVDASRVFLLDSRFDIEQDSSSVLLTLEAN